MPILDALNTNFKHFNVYKLLYFLSIIYLVTSLISKNNRIVIIELLFIL